MSLSELDWLTDDIPPHAGLSRKHPSWAYQAFSTAQLGSDIVHRAPSAVALRMEYRSSAFKAVRHPEESGILWLGPIYKEGQ
jgi:hypothetical protein